MRVKYPKCVIWLIFWVQFVFQITYRYINNWKSLYFKRICQMIIEKSLARNLKRARLTEILIARKLRVPLNRTSWQEANKGYQLRLSNSLFPNYIELHRCLDMVDKKKKEEIWLSPMTKAIHQQKRHKFKVTTQTTPQKSSITQRLRTDLGRSVGVTTANQLVWLIWFTGPTFPLPATAV